MTTPLPAPRPFTHWICRAPCDPVRPANIWSESASIDLIRELIRRHSELVTYGRQRFAGTLAQKNASWRHYRNFLRQAISNFDAAINVPNRSACLLYYYSLLNFAKAELLNTHQNNLVGKFIGHGLQFSTYRAQSIAGDVLTVKSGMFSLLYQKRTGLTIRTNQRLPIKRLLANIPEIGTQLSDAGLGRTAAFPIWQSLVTDGTSAWPVILTPASLDTIQAASIGKAFLKTFRPVNPHFQWREVFGVSKRLAIQPYMFEACRVAPNGVLPLNEYGAQGITWEISSVLSRATNESYDAWITPSLYKQDFIPMPSSLARYALLYYASSLVRYRPSMLDPELYPEQSYLFDAIARECALPILIDTISELEGRDQVFIAAGSFRA